MDKELLLYYLKKTGGSRKDLAAAIGISPRTLDNKLTGRTEFVGSEIKAIADFCRLTPAELFSVFFGSVVE